MVVGNRGEILARIGKAVKNDRLRQNVTQETLAMRSGVSLNSVKHLENGGGANLGTFVLVCRALGKDSWIRSFLNQDAEISPIEYLELLGKKKNVTRVRARRGSGK